MKIKISIIDDDGQELEGELELTPKKIPKQKKKEKTRNENYSGISGGINFLISQKFLNSPRTSKRVFEELKTKGYFYPQKSVEKILRVDFFAKKKILTRIKEKIHGITLFENDVVFFPFQHLQFF